MEKMMKKIRQMLEYADVISPTMYKIFNKFSAKMDKGFTVESHCNLCGTCGKVCPLNNITVDSKVSFNNNCTLCLGCTLSLSL